MTDLENRLWLCEQVLEVKQQGGMSPERALAMLHRLTDLETHEPYLSDQLPVPGVRWDYGEPLVDEHVEVLGLAHAAVDMATHYWCADGYIDLEDEPEENVETKEEADNIREKFEDKDGSIPPERISDYLKALSEEAFRDERKTGWSVDFAKIHEHLTEPPTRLCPICDTVLERRPRESFAEFARRETDSKSCAGQLRSRKNRAAKEAATA